MNFFCERTKDMLLYLIDWKFFFVTKAQNVMDVSSEVVSNNKLSKRLSELLFSAVKCFENRVDFGEDEMVWMAPLNKLMKLEN